MPLLRHLALVGLVLCLLVPAAWARADCAGRDLMATLSQADRAALDRAVAGDRYAEGNHWTARRGTTTISLVGTFHLYDNRMEAIAKRLAPVLAGADTLFVEATDDDVARLKSEIGRDPARLFLTSGPTLPEALSEADWQRLRAAFTARGIPAVLGAKFRPWYVAVLLGLPACLTKGGQVPRPGLDRILSDHAAGNAIPTSALEPWDTALTMFESLPFDRQLDLLRASLPQAAQAEDVLATMTEAYFRQEHRLIWEFSRRAALSPGGEAGAAAQADFALLERAVLADRNRAWIDRLMPLAEGRRVMMAVGAAHLSGPEGLLHLLADRGFTLERQPF